ncbi:MAG TPA: Lrp/AsnC family transcriptional regulator [Candidatus Acidoferrales bacterium]|nr:Lrp/AsnC family transcriptional regulator [Candidatus Acidoferrales bacterium]
MESSAFDDIDRQILRTLEWDGRATIVEVARIVSLSQNATADRLRRLVHMGAIAGFSAQISAEAIGLRLQAYIDVKLRSERAADDFERELATVPGLLECTLTTGSFDYMLRVACRDQDDLVRIAEYLRTTGGAAETYSRIILRERRFPITMALAEPRR